MARKKPQRSKLHVQAIKLLRHRRRTLTVDMISDDVPVLTTSWLRALLQDQIEEPSALKLEALIDFFARDAKIERSSV